MKGRTYPINPTASRMSNHMGRQAVTCGTLPSAPCGPAQAMAWWTRAALITLWRQLPTRSYPLLLSWHPSRRCLSSLQNLFDRPVDGASSA